MATSDKKLVRSKSGLRMIPSKPDLFNPLTLIEPVWVPDSECLQCSSCQTKFDFLNRRHHCRRCGQCFCGACCSNKVALPRLSFVDPVRQCQECCNKTKKEKDFFETHHKMLGNGAHFEVTSTGFIEKSDINRPSIYFCSLSKDSRQITLDCVSNKLEVHDPIELLDVDSVQLLSSSGGSPAASPTEMSPIAGVTVRHKDAEGVMQTVRFVAMTDLTSQRQALSWAQALRMAIKFVFERRDQMKGSPDAQLQ